MRVLPAFLFLFIFGSNANAGWSVNSKDDNATQSNNIGLERTEKTVFEYVNDTDDVIQSISLVQVVRNAPGKASSSKQYVRVKCDSKDSKEVQELKNLLKKEGVKTCNTSVETLLYRDWDQVLNKEINGTQIVRIKRGWEMMKENFHRFAHANLINTLYFELRAKEPEKIDSVLDILSKYRTIDCVSEMKARFTESIQKREDTQPSVANPESLGFIWHPSYER